MRQAGSSSPGAPFAIASRSRPAVTMRFVTSAGPGGRAARTGASRSGWNASSSYATWAVRAADATSRGDRAGSAIVAWAVSICRARAAGSLDTVGPWGPIASDDGPGAAAGRGAAGGGVGGVSVQPTRAASRTTATRSPRPHRPPLTVSERNDVGHPRAWPRRGS